MRTRSGIEAAKGVRRIGSEEKDWWWTKRVLQRGAEKTEEEGYLLVDKHLGLENSETNDCKKANTNNNDNNTALKRMSI